MPISRCRAAAPTGLSASMRSASMPSSVRPSIGWPAARLGPPAEHPQLGRGLVLGPERLGLGDPLERPVHAAGLGVVGRRAHEPDEPRRRIGRQLGGARRGERRRGGRAEPAGDVGRLVQGGRDGLVGADGRRRQMPGAHRRIGDHGRDGRVGAGGARTARPSGRRACAGAGDGRRWWRPRSRRGPRPRRRRGRPRRGPPRAIAARHSSIRPVSSAATMASALRERSGSSPMRRLNARSMPEPGGRPVGIGSTPLRWSSVSARGSSWSASGLPAARLTSASSTPFSTRAGLRADQRAGGLVVEPGERAGWAGRRRRSRAPRRCGRRRPGRAPRRRAAARRRARRAATRRRASGRRRRRRARARPRPPRPAARAPRRGRRTGRAARAARSPARCRAPGPGPPGSARAGAGSDRAARGGPRRAGRAPTRSRASAGRGSRRPTSMAWSSSVVLPMPGSPLTSSAALWPSRAPSRRAAICWTSVSRPCSTGRKATGPTRLGGESAGEGRPSCAAG